MAALDRRTLILGGLLGGAVLATGPGRFIRAAAAQDAFAGEAGATPEERAAMAEAAREFMHRYEIPGLSLAVAHNGVAVYADAFGLAVREGHGEKLTTGHMFRIAGAGKPITAVAIFTLIEDRRLRLDDKVFGTDGILGEDYGRPPYGPGIEDITIDHLLTHTSGGWAAGGEDPMFHDPRMNHAELIAWTLRNRPLQNAPGSVFAFSNFGYCLLGRVIEKLSDQRYGVYVRDKILVPCGIEDMTIAGNALAQRRKHEVRYYGQGGEDPYAMNVARLDSTAGWLARPSDLVRFLVHVDGFPDVPNILRPETVQIMTVPTRANADYAKGWSVSRFGNWWHEGGLPGSTAVAVRTHGDFCWAALANSHRPNSSIDGDLDALVWTMVGKVKSWGV